MLARVDRIADRGTFGVLRRPHEHGGARSRSGPLSMTWVPTTARTAAVRPTDHPAVAFAIGKPVGGAVVRNRLRRRLRAHLRDLPLGAGAFLVSVRPEAAALDFAGLGDHLARCVAGLPPAARAA